MIDRFFASPRRAAAAAASLFVAFVGAGAGIAGCKDDSVSVDQQIQNFCQSYMSSQGFGCCSAADKSSTTFAARYRYSSVENCASTLGAQLASAGSAQSFDPSAAASCLQYVASRACGSAPLLADRQAEEKAGCGRILKGNQAEGAPCNVEADCQAGLFCPSTKETGVANCAKPAGINETCYQQQTDSIDHPACDLSKNLLCLFNTEVTVCPVPPCPEYRCVPRVTVSGDTTQAEACSGNDCVSGAVCTDLSTTPSPTSHQFVCQNNNGGAAGAGCNVTEQCQSGLYCDTTKGVCAQQKANGQSCNPANNTSIFECQGTCGENNVCVSFCGKG